VLSVLMTVSFTVVRHTSCVIICTTIVRSHCRQALSLVAVVIRSEAQLMAVVDRSQSFKAFNSVLRFCPTNFEFGIRYRIGVPTRFGTPILHYQLRIWYQISGTNSFCYPAPPPDFALPTSVFAKGINTNSTSV
jgi:hypothetical protein